MKWCHKGLIAALTKMQGTVGGFHSNVGSGNQPCEGPPTSPVTLKELQWKYLLPNLVFTLT